MFIICHGLPKRKHFSPVLPAIFNISGGLFPLFGALARNRPAVRSTTCAVTNSLQYLSVSYLSLFVVYTLSLGIVEGCLKTEKKYK